jgi:hypothetical protein
MTASAHRSPTRRRCRPIARLAGLLLVALAAAGCFPATIPFTAECELRAGVLAVLARPFVTLDQAYFLCIVRLFNPFTERAASEAVDADFLPVPQSPNDRPTTVTCSSDRCATLNFAPTGSHICSATACDFVAHPINLGSIQFSPDGRTLLAGGNNGSTLQILESVGVAAAGPATEALPAVRPLVVPGNVQSFATQAIAFDPITSRAHVCTTAGIAVLDPPYTSVPFTVPLSNCAGVAVAPDGSVVAAARLNNTVSFFQGPLAPGATAQTLVVPVAPGQALGFAGLAFARDGSVLVAPATNVADVYLIEPPYGSASAFKKVAFPGAAGGGWKDVAFDPTNAVAAIAGASTPVGAADPTMPVGSFPFGEADFSTVSVAGGRGLGAVRFLEEAPCAAAIPAPRPAGERATPARPATEAVGPLVAAVLPLSRSVRVGCPATAFVTVINSGDQTAAGVSIAPATAMPASFVYQTTDASNALTGTPDTPADIPPGSAQSFIIALTPTAPFLPTDVAFTIAGTNVGGAAVLPGINTLKLAASPARTGDPVALAATPGNTGIVDIPGASGTGAFAVATVNVGINSVLTVSADTGSVVAAAATEAVLPVTIRVCQTNTATGLCLADPAPSVKVAVGAGATPSFAVFVEGGGVVPLDPAANRVFVRLRDQLGNERGSTSVAVRTVAVP